MSDQQWLNPVEALTRFQPPEHIHFGQEETLDEFVVRYGYRIGDHGFLVKPETRSEVVEEHTVHPVPLTESFVRGMVNLRGNLVPVFDLVPLLTSDKVGSQSQTVLVVGDGGDEIGVLVDDIPRAIYDSGTRSEAPALPESFQEFVRETIPHGGTNWVEFDCQAYFRAYASHQIDISYG